MLSVRISRTKAVWLGSLALLALAGLLVFTVLWVRIDAPDKPVARSRDYPWMSLATWWQKHEAIVRIDAATRRRAELVLVGDSIVQGWDQAVWNEYYAPLHALNLGIGGDKTQQVIWRLGHGEIDGLEPKVVLVLIGTNNLGSDGAPPAGVARGIAKILDVLRLKLPRSKVLLLGILPRDRDPSAPVRRQIADTNALLERLADGQRVRFVDVGSKLLEPDRTISADVMADYLHPTARGYRRLSDAIQPFLRGMLR